MYNKIEDYTRMVGYIQNPIIILISFQGIREMNDPHWTINTQINRNYALCDTYPDTLVLPAKFDASRIGNVAAFRSRNRLPVR